jgi:hypothetical protein
MNTSREETMARAWARLGVMFNVELAERTPDVERLLLDTARMAGGNSRLLIMAAAWLDRYADYVAKRRLAVLLDEELEAEYRPVMGLLLEWVQSRSSRHRHRFREAIKRCEPAKEPRPLLKVYERNQVLRRLARMRASKLSHRWGRWMEEFELREDALRPAEWIAEANPSLRIRAICGGDLVATIAADGAQAGVCFQSESALARRYGASRAAIRDAITRLKMGGVARQVRRGKAHEVEVMAQPAGGFAHE